MNVTTVTSPDFPILYYSDDIVVYYKHKDNKYFLDNIKRALLITACTNLTNGAPLVRTLSLEALISLGRGEYDRPEQLASLSDKELVELYTRLKTARFRVRYTVPKE